VFTRYASVDVALGWPLRYSHSPGEVIDTMDLGALGQIVATLCAQMVRCALALRQHAN
jgi:putative aminopeptidase FrvX